MSGDVSSDLMSRLLDEFIEAQDRMARLLTEIHLRDLHILALEENVVLTDVRYDWLKEGLARQYHAHLDYPKGEEPLCSSIMMSPTSCVLKVGHRQRHMDLIGNEWDR